MLNVLVMILSIFLSVYLFLLLQSYSMLHMQSMQKSDVIVVLGARSYTGTTINPCLRGRVEHGVTLFKKGVAPRIIMTGGVDRAGERSEAEVMRELALTSGIPASVIFLDSSSKSTYENLLNAKHIMENHGWNTATIVSDGYHLNRASLIANKLRLPHFMSAAKESPCSTTAGPSGLFFEPYHIVLNKLQGHL